MVKAGSLSTRICHEVHQSPQSCAGTFTFDDAHVPDSIEELPKIVDAFKKRCRRRDIDPRSIILCEYGGEGDRPHFHPVFFNTDFRDCGIEKRDGSQYISHLLLELWPYGHHLLDIASPSACGYIGGHTSGKIHVPRRRPDGTRSQFIIPAGPPAIGWKYAERFAGDLISLNAAMVGPSLRGVPKPYLVKGKELFGSIVEHNREYALAKPADNVPVTIAESDASDQETLLIISQGYAMKAWHRGGHDECKADSRSRIVSARNRAKFPDLVK